MKNHFYLIPLLILPIGVYLMTREPKNVRNKNPLNIEKGADWKGLQAIQNDVRFAQFQRPEWGFRAGYVILLKYLERGEDNLQKIINKWAPSGTDDRNHTDNYIDYIADKVQLSPSETVTHDLLPEIMLHMSNFEGGKGHFTIEQAQQGETLAKQENFVQSRLARIEENSGWFGGVFG
jgi:hypothetical protein